jgi:hypothetical protein
VDTDAFDRHNRQPAPAPDSWPSVAPARPASPTSRIDDVFASIRGIWPANTSRQQRVTALELANQQLQTDLAASRATVDALRQEIQQLRRQLHTAPAATSVRPESTRDGREAHGVIAVSDAAAMAAVAEAYTGWTEQTVQHLARTCATFTDRLAGQPQNVLVASLIGRLCAALLPHVPPDIRQSGLERLIGPRAASDPTITALLTAAARAAHQLARPLGSNAEPCWDFTARTGTLLDPARQEPWAQCDPEAPVQFVVAPGLVIAGRVVRRQRVYTAYRP